MLACASPARRTAMKKLTHSLLIFSLVVAVLGVVMVPGVSAQTGGCSTTHIVQRGETLYRIALRYRTSIADIQARNAIVNPDRIFAGQRLCISGGFVPEPNPNPNPNPGPAPAGTLRVITHTLNIRSGPGLNYGVLGQARNGHTFSVVGRTWDSNWYQIIYGAVTGNRAWVFAPLTRTANPQSLPIVNVPNAPTTPYSAYVTLNGEATT
jgi:LysM repeat protein